MVDERRRPAMRSVVVVAGGAALALALFAPAVFAAAQEREAGGDEAPHPIHVHGGTCEELGEIVAALGDVVPIAGEVAGAGSAVPVELSETEIDLPLADVLAAPHAINVHLSAEAIDEYVACGDVGGAVADGRLTIGLGEVGGSDAAGVAVLEEDGPETEVTVFLFHEGSTAVERAGAADAAGTPAVDDGAATAIPDETDGEDAADATPEATAAPAAEGTPEATEAADEATGNVVEVEIRGFAFAPDPVTIVAGDTVTWTNNDGVPHTATGEDRAVLQSGTIEPGGSFSQTFEEPGEFPYFCEFHAGMTGTIVVE